MDDSLKKQVVNSNKYKYFKELKNKYTGFLRITCHNLLKHLLNQYGNITTPYLKANNQRMNDPNETPFPIENYFEHVNYCI